MTFTLHPHDEDRAFRISGGAVETLTLPPHPQVYTVPEGITSAGLDGTQAPVCLLPGRAHGHYEAHALPLVAEVATRLTPWATWYAAPGWFAAGTFSGQAWPRDEVAICRTTCAPPGALEVAFHEAWHLCEVLMRPAVLAELDAQLGDGPAWPGDYYPQAIERRARAFAHFAMLVSEGCRLTVGAVAPAEVRLFWHVLNGDFAREVMAPAPQRKVTLREKAATTLGGLLGFRGMESHPLVSRG